MAPELANGSAPGGCRVVDLRPPTLRCSSLIALGASLHLLGEVETDGSKALRGIDLRIGIARCLGHLLLELLAEHVDDSHSGSFHVDERGPTVVAPTLGRATRPEPLYR